jgi:hypothetical protein
MDLAAQHQSKLIDQATGEVELWRRRPDPSTWSALEYACHIRDCFGLYDWRIRKVSEADRVVLPANAT